MTPESPDLLLGQCDSDDDIRRHEVVDVDTGEVLVKMLAFLGTGNVRMVCVAELNRSGYTLYRDEAVRWRDALTEAIEEIDRWRHAA